MQFTHHRNRIRIDQMPAALAGERKIVALPGEVADRVELVNKHRPVRTDAERFGNALPITDVARAVE